MLRQTLKLIVFSLCVQLEAIVFPVLKRLVSSEGQDVLEEVMELLAYFTYYSPTLSDAMWSLWPQVRFLLPYALRLKP